MSPNDDLFRNGHVTQDLNEVSEYCWIEMRKYVALIIKNSQSTTEESQPWDETNTIYGKTETNRI